MSTPAGWYPDPQIPGQMRFWDGSAWTEQTGASANQPAYPTYPVGPPIPDGSAPATGAPVLAIVALVLAVVIAPVGFVLSIIGLVTARGRRLALVLSAIALVVSLVIMAAIAAVIVLAVKTTDASAKVSDEFVADLQHKDAAAAYQLTDSTFRRQTSEQQLAQFLQAAGDNLSRPVKRLDRGISARSGSGAVAEVIYSTGGTAGTVYLDVQLQKVGGDWRVAGVKATKSRPHLPNG